MTDLLSLLSDACEAELLAATRVHPLRSLPGCWIKREDEAAYGIPGCKRRKYASLLPWLSARGIASVGLLGGSRSNHILGFLQLCRERGLRVRLFLKEAHAPARPGEPPWLSLLADPSEIRWIASADWPRAEDIARAALAAEDPGAFLLPEGGSCAPALPGACTLLPDILRNERESGLRFERIVLDSGTALTAGALLLMDACLGLGREVHVVLAAGDEAYFRAQLLRFRGWLEDFAGRPLPLPEGFQLHFPPAARSFGAVNAAVRSAQARIARSEGILCDAVYMTKTFMALEAMLPALPPRPTLLIHSGGLLR
jgi:1-aminocyclopropane-1-carboxylate deaminase/D-cysteine desulfhydrase-like pyridoxal-dependent ACC family enzyme